MSINKIISITVQDNEVCQLSWRKGRKKNKTKFQIISSTNPDFHTADNCITVSPFSLLLKLRWLTSFRTKTLCQKK